MTESKLIQDLRIKTEMFLISNKNKPGNQITGSNQITGNQTTGNPTGLTLKFYHFHDTPTF